jgi:hypothetical protein
MQTRADKFCGRFPALCNPHKIRGSRRPEIGPDSAVRLPKIFSRGYRACAKRGGVTRRLEAIRQLVELGLESTDEK